MAYLRVFFISLLAALALAACQPPKFSDEPSRGSTQSVGLTIFAAASTTNAIQELASLYAAVAGVRITPSFAASSTLARQIKAGAPVDIFLSANPQWMDYLEAEDRLIDGSRRQLLGNRLVLIAPADSPLSRLRINADLNILDLLAADGRLAMGDPSHVPAGLYGKQALESLDLWETAGARIAPMADVRAATTMVERGETPIGVVYATDAAISARVKVIGTFPADTHAPIVYPVALVKGANVETARALLEFFEDPRAREIFRKYGFVLAN